MKLYIDTRKSEGIVVGLDPLDGSGQAIYETKARKDMSQKLLPFIDELLKKRSVTIRDISEIEVETGPGSFTGLRVGISVANVLGWALGAKVNGRNVSKEGPVEPRYT